MLIPTIQQIVQRCAEIITFYCSNLSSILSRTISCNVNIQKWIYCFLPFSVLSVNIILISQAFGRGSCEVWRRWTLDFFAVLSLLSHFEDHPSFEYLAAFIRTIKLYRSVLITVRIVPLKNDIDEINTRPVVYPVFFLTYS